MLLRDMPESPSVVLVKKHPFGDYYDYVGRVNVIRGPDGSVSYVVITDRKTGEYLGQIAREHNDEFVKHEGKVIRFRGRVDKHRGVIISHNK
jgi:hypothetical protein